MFYTTSVRAVFLAVVTSVSMLLLLATPAMADFPSKPVTIVVPFGPGGATDQSSRIIAERFQAALGQPVIVMNRPGAGGMIGSHYVAKSQPDGYTLLLTTASTFGGIQSSSVITDVPYDMHKDFDHVTLIGWTPRALAVSKNYPGTSLTYLIRDAKNRPGEVAYSMIPGTIEELAMKIFQIDTKTKLNAVPYAGGAGNAILDVVSGRVPVMLDTLPSLNRAGDGVRVIAVTSPQRLQSHPDVPTFAELGLSDLTFRSYVGIAVPANTPKDIVEKLNAALISAIHHPEVKARLAQVGIESAGTTSAEASKSVADIANMVSSMATRAKTLK
jgi:tripartite-type tricarboxylate transporter receptor subunit TctC